MSVRFPVHNPARWHTIHGEECERCSAYRKEQRAAAVSAAESAVVEAAERWHQADGAYKEFVEREQVANVYDVDRTLVALFGRLEESQSALRSACSALAAARNTKGADSA